MHPPETDDLDDLEIEVYDGLTEASYGPPHRLVCFSCKTACLIQLTDDKPLSFCPHCGASSESADDEEDEDDGLEH